MKTGPNYTTDSSTAVALELKIVPQDARQTPLTVAVLFPSVTKLIFNRMTNKI